MYARGASRPPAAGHSRVAERCGGGVGGAGDGDGLRPRAKRRPVSMPPPPHAHSSSSSSLHPGRRCAVGAGACGCVLLIKTLCCKSCRVERHALWCPEARSVVSRGWRAPSVLSRGTLCVCLQREAHLSNLFVARCAVCAGTCGCVLLIKTLCCKSCRVKRHALWCQEARSVVSRGAPLEAGEHVVLSLVRIGAVGRGARRAVFVRRQPARKR